LVGQRHAEVTLQQMPDPLPEAGQRRQVQSQLRTERRHGFRGGGLAEHGLGDITREHADCEKNDH
jgi:hypothetical protein